jgi:hypothetical protein
MYAELMESAYVFLYDHGRAVLRRLSKTVDERVGFRAFVFPNELIPISACQYQGYKYREVAENEMILNATLVRDGLFPCLTCR